MTKLKIRKFINIVFKISPSEIDLPIKKRFFAGENNLLMVFI